MTASDSPPGKARHLILLVLILALAAALRFYRATSHSLCYDEMWHIANSTGNGSPQNFLPPDTLVTAPAATSLLNRQSPWRVWTNIEHIVHPPLQHVTLWFWRYVLGPGDLAAQSFSILAALMAIVFLFDAARLTAGPRAALWACLIVAIAPVEIFLTQQVRAYAMLQMLTLGAAALLIRIELYGATRGRVAGLGIAVLGMLLSHYFAVGAAAALGLFALTRLRGAARKNALAAILLAGLVFAAVWGPFMWAQRRDVVATADTWLREDRSDHLLLTMKRLLALPAMQLIDSPDLNRGAIVIGGAILALIVIPIRRRELRIWSLLLAGTFGFVFLLDVFRSTTHLLYMRYTMLGVPAMLVLMCAAFSRFNGIRAHLSAAAVGVLCLLGLRDLTRIAEEPDYRPLGAFVQRHVADDEPIFFASADWVPWYSEVLYLASSHYSHRFPHPIVKLSKPADEKLIRSVNSRTAWVISPPADPAMLVPGAQMIERYEIPLVAFCVRIRLPD